MDILTSVAIYIHTKIYEYQNEDNKLVFAKSIHYLHRQSKRIYKQN